MEYNIADIVKSVAYSKAGLQVVDMLDYIEKHGKGGNSPIEPKNTTKYYEDTDELPF